MEESTKDIWTIGHSTRSFPEFLDLLRSFEIEQLVDVRRYPGSKKFPHFNKENLEVSLPESNIDYLHLQDLGGRRKPKIDSDNMEWRLASFRGYADYMESEEFKDSMEKLMEYADRRRVAYMCSEAVWWSCHRSLVSDYLKIRGWKVHHIMGVGKELEHPFTKPAKVVDGRLSYSDKKIKD